ncbi:HD domain-containing protein [Neobittarella massiliensis]|uniref:HD domain-containing protein n=1 Tax=Neobittarella massiliensis (ex Bilen et al. 2018) TaxID=2041842 RepID=A0A8J6INI9_9FIRM|nr:HD domain-containing protein [Neobittarella massiliensis]MBC3515857.1 HD domain-containing protein [Neobittarella massiliensis]
MDYKEEFIRIFNEQVTRPGADRLLNWLEKTDFFTAPASTRFHCACQQGLVRHSLSVYQVLMEKHFVEGEDNPESFAICGLLHDLCKAQFYKVSTRNVKNEQTGQWEKVPFYQVEDVFPYGHGEKSVFLIERFMRLKTAEAMAIRWHMGGFDESVKGGSFAMSGAFRAYPLAVKMHLADLESTYIRERDTSDVPNEHR